MHFSGSTKQVHVNFAWMPYTLYVIELDREVLTRSRFSKANPDPCSRECVHPYCRQCSTHAAKQVSGLACRTWLPNLATEGSGSGRSLLSWFHPGGFNPPNMPAKEPTTAEPLNPEPRAKNHRPPTNAHQEPRTADPRAKNQAHPNHRTKCRWPRANRTLNPEPPNPEPRNRSPISSSWLKAHSSRPPARGSKPAAQNLFAKLKNPFALPRPSPAPPCTAIASPCAPFAPPCAASARVCAPFASPSATPHKVMRGLRTTVRAHCITRRPLRVTISTTRATISALRGTVRAPHNPRNALRIRHTCHCFRQCGFRSGLAPLPHRMLRVPRSLLRGSA